MKKTWWKEGVVYQIYPISFMDSNGDGFGDLNGITEKLDYLADIGVSIVWISPYFKSPLADNGYDISDYREIDRRFGTMQDWDNLIKEMHKRNLKLVMDLVVNHCSDEHEWFKEARKSKDNTYRDYFIWKDGKAENTPPNNWSSYFSGSAWEYDEKTNQYYLHLYDRKQPDFNWENPKLRNELYQMMKFWLDKGVDGFRLDVMHGYAKTPGFPDGEPGMFPVGVEHSASLPRNHEYIREMNREVFSKYDIMTVGETDGTTIEDALQYSAESSREVNMVFHFQHIDLDSVGNLRWTVPSRPAIKDLKKILADWQRGLLNRGWNSLYLSNHDQARQVSRFGDDTVYRVVSAKMLATVMHLQQGTPYIFQGEEIGMTNRKIKSLEEVRDVESINAYHLLVDSGKLTAEQMISGINKRGRDNGRTPIQWSDAVNAGFSCGHPWIDVNPNYKTINVKVQQKDPDSVLNYYKKLIRLRKQNPIVVYGDFEEYYSESDQIFAFARRYEGQILFVLANMTGDKAGFQIPEDIQFGQSSLYISNYENSEMLCDCTLRPYECKAYLLK